jgi:hypothetical protein
MKKKLEHWAVIEHKDGYGIALVEIDLDDPGTIYWNGGPSYTVNAKYKILEDIMVDTDSGEDLKAIDTLELHMYQKYDERYAPATEPMCSEGWISPDGKVYYCGYGEHRYSARPISATYYGEIAYNSEKFLEDKKWLKIYKDGMIIRGDWGWKCTQKQIDAIGWLLTAKGADPRWAEELKDHIEMFEVED